MFSGDLLHPHTPGYHEIAHHFRSKSRYRILKISKRCCRRFPPHTKCFQLFRPFPLAVAQHLLLFHFQQFHHIHEKIAKRNFYDRCFFFKGRRSSCAEQFSSIHLCSVIEKKFWITSDSRVSFVCLFMRDVHVNFTFQFSSGNLIFPLLPSVEALRALCLFLFRQVEQLSSIMQFLQFSHLRFALLLCFHVWKAVEIVSLFALSMTSRDTFMDFRLAILFWFALKEN